MAEDKQKVKIKYNKCFTVLVNNNGLELDRIPINLSLDLENYNSKNPPIIQYLDGIKFALVNVYDENNCYVMQWQKLVDRNLPQFSTLEGIGFTTEDIPLTKQNRWISISDSYIFVCKTSSKIFFPVGYNTIPKSVLRRYFIESLDNRGELEYNQSIDVREVVNKDKIPVGIDDRPIHSLDFKQTNPVNFRNYIKVNDTFGFTADVKLRFPNNIGKKLKKQNGLISVGSFIETMDMSAPDFDATIRYYDELDNSHTLLLKDYTDFEEKYFYLERNQKITYNDILDEFKNKFSIFKLDFENI